MQRCKDGVWKISSRINKKKKDVREDFFTEALSNSGIEGVYTYSTVPGLGKQRGKRENTVNMRGSMCGRSTKRQ